MGFFLTVPELADRLGKSPITIRRWLAERFLPEPDRAGRTILWRRDMIDTWLEAIGQDAIRDRV